MNSIYKVLIVAVAACFLVCGLAFSAYTYDTDPVITLSYLNDVFIPQIKQDILQTILAQDSAEPPSLPAEQPQEILDSSYDVIEISYGQTVLATDCLEVILRPGGEVACVSANDMGLCDVTAGTDIFNGQPLANNHYVIISRADGRGVICTSEKAYLLVRGGYEIE